MERKMKRLFVAFALIAVVLIGCKMEEDPEFSGYYLIEETQHAFDGRDMLTIYLTFQFNVSPSVRPLFDTDGIKVRKYTLEKLNNGVGNGKKTFSQLTESELNVYLSPNGEDESMFFYRQLNHSGNAIAIFNDTWIYVEKLYK
jgi:hypothetical protein